MSAGVQVIADGQVWDLPYSANRGIEFDLAPIKDFHKPRTQRVTLDVSSAPALLAMALRGENVTIRVTHAGMRSAHTATGVITGSRPDVREIEVSVREWTHEERA